MFVSMVTFSIGALSGTALISDLFPWEGTGSGRERPVRSTTGSGEGSVRSTISLFEVGVKYLVIKLVWLLIVSVIITCLIAAVQRAI